MSSARNPVDDMLAQPVLQREDRRCSGVDIEMKVGSNGRDPRPWNAKRHAAARSQPSIPGGIPECQTTTEPGEQRDRTDLDVCETRRFPVAQLEYDSVHAP